MRAAMFTTAISTMAFSSSKDFTQSKHRFSLGFRPPSLPNFTGGSVRRRPFSLKLKNIGSNFPTLLAFSGDGTGNGNGSGRSSGGDGGREENENEKEASLIVLPEGSRSSDSLPPAGRISETTPLIRWLMQFEGVKQRLLADDRFAVKVMMECVVRMLTEVATFKVFEGGVLDGNSKDIASSIKWMILFGGFANNNNNTKFLAEYRMKCSSNRLSMTTIENKRHKKKKNIFEELEVIFEYVVATFKVFGGGVLDGNSMDIASSIKWMIPFGGFANNNNNFLAEYRMKCSGNRLSMVQD